MEKTIHYGDSELSVSNEVAEFLENDRKRQAAEERSDRRHISKSNSETVSAVVHDDSFSDPTWEAVLRTLTLEKLQQVLAELTEDDRILIYLYFYCEWTMEDIGEEFGISKMAIFKRLKKLLHRMRESMET